MSKFLKAVKEAPDTGRKIEKRLPASWQPGVEVIGGRATAVSRGTYEATPKESELIKAWQMDPKEWRIDGAIQCRRWQAYDERWLYYYKANLVKVGGESDRTDIEALIKTDRKSVV